MSSNHKIQANEWKEILLGEVLKYEQPYKYAVESTQYGKSGIPVLTAGKSFILGYTSEINNIYSNLPVIIFDDFTTDCKYVDFPFKVKSSAMKFLKERNEKEISLKFIFGILQTVRLNTIGGDHKRRWISEYSKIKVQAPDFNEQTHIAEILGTADEAITRTEALIAKYQRIKTGLMQDLLTRGIDENGNIRSKSTHKFVFKKGIEVPEEWDVDNLAAIINAIDPQPNHRTPPQVDSGIPYLGINDIDDYGNIDYSKCRKVSERILIEHNKRYQLSIGDIIFGKIGTIGEPKRLVNLNNLTLSANVILIQPKENSDFVYWLLNSETIKQQVKNSIHSTSQPAFGMEKIRALKVSIPKPKEQEKIGLLLNDVQQNIFSMTEHLQKLQTLKTGLMQDLLSGRVRVSI